MVIFQVILIHITKNCFIVSANLSYRVKWCKKNVKIVSENDVLDKCLFRARSVLLGLFV
jgi:hypothetical protein